MVNITDFTVIKDIIFVVLKNSFPDKVTKCYCAKTPLLCSAGCAEWGSNMALSAVTTPLSSTVPANELDGKFGRLSVQ